MKGSSLSETSVMKEYEVYGKNLANSIRIFPQNAINYAHIPAKNIFFNINDNKTFCKWFFWRYDCDDNNTSLKI